MKHFFVDWLIYPDHPRRTKAMHIAFLVLYFLFMVAGPFITISIEYGWWNRTPSAGGVGGPVVVTIAFMVLTTLILATKKIKKISENDYKTRRVKHICLMLIYLLIPGLIALGAWYSNSALTVLYHTIEWSMLWIGIAICIDQFILSEYEHYYSILDKVNESEAIDYIKSKRQ